MAFRYSAEKQVRKPLHLANTSTQTFHLIYRSALTANKNNLKIPVNMLLLLGVYNIFISIYIYNTCIRMGDVR